MLCCNYHNSVLITVWFIVTFYFTLMKKCKMVKIQYNNKSKIRSGMIIKIRKKFLLVSNSLKIFLLRRWRIYAVPSMILFIKHQILNSSCSVIQSTLVNFELNTFPCSLQHLHSLSVGRMTQWLWQLHRCKFSNLLLWLSTIMEINYWTNGRICAKVVFHRYTESVKFRSQSRERASKRKPYRGLGTR